MKKILALFIYCVCLPAISCEKNMHMVDDHKVYLKVYHDSAVCEDAAVVELTIPPTLGGSNFAESSVLIREQGKIIFYTAFSKFVCVGDDYLASARIFVGYGSSHCMRFKSGFSITGLTSSDSEQIKLNQEW